MKMRCTQGSRAWVEAWPSRDQRGGKAASRYWRHVQGLFSPPASDTHQLAQTRLAQSKQKTEVAKLTVELDMTAKSLKDAKQRFGALQVQHRKKELEYEKLQNHLRDLLCEKVALARISQTWRFTTGREAMHAPAGDVIITNLMIFAS